MNFEKFRKIFTTYGVFYVEFSFVENDKNTICIENSFNAHYTNSITVNGEKKLFHNCQDVFDLPLIDGMNLENLWSKLQIEIIDEMDADDFEKWYSVVEQYVPDYFYGYQEGRINANQFVEKLNADEINGNLLLLAGTDELCNINPSNFKVVVDVPQVNRIYVISSVDSNIQVNALSSDVNMIMQVLKRDKRYKSGRLFTFYNDKNAKNKSEKYIELLKYEKSRYSTFWGCFFFTVEVLSLMLLIYSVTKVSQKPYLFIGTLTWFVLSWVLVFQFGKVKGAREGDFREKYLPNLEPNAVLQLKMNDVIWEKYQTGFESLLSRVKNSVPKIKVRGLCYENGCIDFQLEKSEDALCFNFNPKILSVMDENNKVYYFKYSKYSYEELEDELVELIVKYFK